MSVNIEEEVNKGLNWLMNRKNLSETDIDEYTNEKMNAINALMNGNLATKEEINRINFYIKQRLNHKIVRTNSILKLYDYEAWFMNRKGEIELKYWERYKKYLKFDKHFSQPIIDSIDDVTDEIVDLAGDPTDEKGFQRRGLIIGDVQSGKTSNFIGLMCKAYDAGYKLIVVLAGTSNVLRKQTQSRIDEGLIGLDSDNKLLNNRYTPIGAAVWGNKDDMPPVCITSTSKDFNKNIANQMALNLNQANGGIILVIKKNVSVLKNLNAWIKSLNQTNEKGLIESSLLVIDDEADYASINTNKEENDPTKTNEKITELLSLFTKVSYIGFTATPYANVFINPETTEDMKVAPLFPKDFIYCLDAPSNYVGARNLFSDDEIDSSIKTIENNDEYMNPSDSIHSILPLNHKKDATFEQVPKSLKRAIHEFVIGNVIRDLRGESNTHRSMLINISRFVNVHEKIKTTIEQYMNSLKRSVIFYSKLDNENWKKDEYMANLFDVYNKEYKKICENYDYANSIGVSVINWNDIKSHLYESVANIVVRVVNQKTKDEMDFSKYKEKGLRVIAIGGIALSRGLTLEGLMVSYFFRNSQTYDTLMQMGRWFGYREGYQDLCRIWMTDDMQENYVEINRATEELREDIIRYKNSGLTPLDFGIKVRTTDALLITARNKMRTAEEKLVECTLSSKVIETKYLSFNLEDIQNNYVVTNNFLENLNQKYTLKKNTPINNQWGYKDVDYQIILDYLKDFQIPVANIEFEANAFENFVNDNINALQKWDVAIIQGKSDRKIPGSEFNCTERVIDIKPNTKLIRVSGPRTRVGGPSDGLFGLSVEELETIKKEAFENKSKKNLSQTDYFRSTKRNPLLCIYYISPKPYKGKINSDLENVIKLSNEFSLVALNVGIPNLGIQEKMVKYAFNNVYMGLNQRNINLDVDIEDDDYE
jgi:hypothetical protein